MEEFLRNLARLWGCAYEDLLVVVYSPLDDEETEDAEFFRSWLDALPDAGKVDAATLAIGNPRHYSIFVRGIIRENRRRLG